LFVYIISIIPTQNKIYTNTVYGSDFARSHTMTSPLVHPVATRRPDDVISISVHVTSQVVNSDCDWTPLCDVTGEPRKPCDVTVIVVMTSWISRSTGKFHDLPESCNIDNIGLFRTLKYKAKTLLLDKLNIFIK